MSLLPPDPLTARRIANLERQVEQLQQQLRLMAVSRGVTPLNARLWRATLNEAFGATTADIAAADLVTLDGTDTLMDVSLYDPLGVSGALAADDALLCFEQIDVDGTTRFVPMAAGGITNKLLCRFTLDAALATTDASKAATITHQYGPGSAHASTSITVYNLAKAGSGYLFEGASGAAGLAYWDSGTSWRIIQMECP
jgi:hypothetical protein